MPTINLTLEEYDTLRKNVTDLQNEIVALRAVATDARFQAQDAGTQALLEAVQAALPVVQFAVANLDPSTIRGWPYGHLATLAALLPDIPGLTDHERECAVPLREFAEEAYAHEQARPKAKAVPARPEDFGPQTAEAKAVHEAHSRRNNS